MYLSCFSPTVRWSGIPFPPQGLPRMGFPCFTGTMGCSESLPPFPPHFVAFAWRYHVCDALFRVRPFAAPTAGRRTGGRPGVCCAGCPIPARNVETTGLPRFLGNPDVDMPCPSTPAGPAGPGHFGPPDTAFRRQDGVGSRDDSSFGAQSHGLLTRCLRFAAEVTLGPRKTRFRLLANFAGRGWIPAGFHCKV